VSVGGGVEAAEETMVPLRKPLWVSQGITQYTACNVSLRIHTHTLMVADRL